MTNRPTPWTKAIAIALAIVAVCFGVAHLAESIPSHVWLGLLLLVVLGACCWSMTPGLENHMARVTTIQKSAGYDEIVGAERAGEVWRTGDEARLRTGGPTMTVTAIGPGAIQCAWFEGTTLRKEWLSPDAVDPVN